MSPSTDAACIDSSSELQMCIFEQNPYSFPRLQLDLFIALQLPPGVKMVCSFFLWACCHQLALVVWDAFLSASWPAQKFLLLVSPQCEYWSLGHCFHILKHYQSCRKWNRKGVSWWPAQMWWVSGDWSVFVLGHNRHPQVLLAMGILLLHFSERKTEYLGCAGDCFPFG